MTEADLQAPSVSLHWYGGGQFDVGLTGKVGGTQMTAQKQTWTVEAPTNVSYTLTPGPIANIGIHNGWLDLGWNRIGAITRAGSATMPAHFGGNLAVVQTIATGHFGRLAGDARLWECVTNDYWCDWRFPTAQAHGGAASNTSLSTGDTPGMPLAGWEWVNLEYQFQTWLMFAPDGGSWVPLSKGAWFCGAEATLSQGAWTLNRGHIAAYATQPTNQHPLWSKGRDDQVKWVPAPPPR